MSSYTKAQNIEIAQSQVSKYSQYAGYFDGWIEVRIRKTIRTKLGVAFVKDELAIAKAEIRKVHRMTGNIQGEGVLFMTVWSISNQIATSVEFKDIEIIETNISLNFVEG